MQQVFPSPPTQTASAPQTPRALSSSSSQHGLQADHASGSGSQLVRSPSRGSVSVGSDATSGFASESWADGIDFERFNERLRGLSVANNRSGGQSPGKRIADHENAASPVARTARRRVEFKVIPRVGEAPPDSPSITDFPNGKRDLTRAESHVFLHSQLTRLLLYRGLDKRHVIPASRVLRSHVPRLQAV